VRITDSQKEKLECAAEELQSLAHLLERMISQNLQEQDTGEELIAVSRLWESVLEAQKQLKTIRNYDRRRTTTSRTHDHHG
jgi:hypothetical protein